MPRYRSGVRESTSRRSRVAQVLHDLINRQAPARTRRALEVALAWTIPRRRASGCPSRCHAREAAIEHRGCVVPHPPQHPPQPARHTCRCRRRRPRPACPDEIPRSLKLRTITSESGSGCRPFLPVFVPERCRSRCAYLAPGMCASRYSSSPFAGLVRSKRQSITIQFGSASLRRERRGIDQGLEHVSSSTVQLTGEGTILHRSRCRSSGSSRDRTVSSPPPG